MEKVLVSGPEEKWLGRAFFLISLKALFSALWIPRGAQAAMNWPLFLGGAAFLGLAIFRTWWVIRQRRWVVVTPTGFNLIDRRGERSFSHHHLICMTLSVKPRFTRGILKSRLRKFVVWAEGESGAEQIEMINLLQPHEADPLEQLILHSSAHLHSAAREALEQGDTVGGEGWSLQGNELTVGSGPTARFYHVFELSSADVIADHVCVWQQGRDEPIARIPVPSANSHILRLLLQERIPPHAESATEVTGDGLGRILFEKQPSPAAGAALKSIAAASLLVSIACELTAVATGNFSFWSMLAALSLVPGLCAVLIASQTQVTFRCRAHGIHCIYLWGERKLRYSELKSFQYHAVQQFASGKWVDTKVDLEFVPLPGGGQTALKHTLIVKDFDELENLRDRIAQVISERMELELATHHAAAWIPRLRLLPEGLEYRPFGFIVARRPIFIPYEHISSLDLQSDRFLLFVRGRRRALFNEPTSRPNFFPGFLLLTKFVEDRAPVLIEGSSVETIQA